MKSLVIFANCQSTGVGKTLLEHPVFSVNYRWDVIPPVQTMTAKHVDEVLAKVRNADLFVYQKVAPASVRPQGMDSDTLLGQLKPDAQACSFPSIYFDGYFPHLQTLNGAVSVLNLAHDYFMAYACASGMSEDRFAELIRSPDFYPKEVSLRLLEESIRSLEKKEAADQVTVKVSRYIRENYRQTKLFNQFNHPKRDVIAFVAEEILRVIGITDAALNKGGDSHLDEIMTPIYRSTHRNLKLEFEEDFDTYSGARRMKYTQAEVIRRFFEFYRTQDLDNIRSLVRTRKPFVSEIVDLQME